MYIPRQLYSKEILTILKNSILDKNIKFSFQLDDILKDQLYAHAIKCLDHDVDLFFSKESLKNISDYIINRDYDNFIDFHHQVKRDAFDHFSKYFDEMIIEITNEIELEKALVWNESA